jgi:hypothetical protein
METCEPVESDLPPVLKAPRVKNLWCVYGINIDTEVSYYFKDVKGKPHADRTMDKERCVDHWKADCMSCERERERERESESFVPMQ